MAINFHFNSEAEAQAFELGLWFHCPPSFQTAQSGTTVTITSDFGHGQTDIEYRWDCVSGDPVDVGAAPLISEIVLPTVREAQAFAGGLNWLSTVFVNVSLSGAFVTVTERRGEGENAGVLRYDLATLRRLIADYRAKFPITSASA